MHKKKQTIIGLLLFTEIVLISLPLLGQRLNLHQSLEIAKENYPSIKAKYAMIEASIKENQEAKTNYIPKVTLQHQYTFATTNNLEGAFYPTNGTLSPSGGIKAYNSAIGTYGSFTTALMEWNIFAFGQNYATAKAAKAGITVSQMDLENEILNHQVKVADTYLLLLMAQQLTKVRERNLERTKNFNEAVNASVKAGLRAEVDNLLAKAEYEKAKISLLENQRMESVYRYRLMELLGMDNSTDTMQIEDMTFYTHLPLYTDQERNVLNSPMLKLQQAKAIAANEQANAIRKNIFPVVSFVAAGWARGSGISIVDGSVSTDFASGTQYQVSNYLLGVSARWIITDGFSVMNRYNKQKYIAKQNADIYDQQHLQLNRQIADANRQYEVMLEQVNAVQVQYSASQLAFNQADARYKNGLSDLPTMLQSMVGLNQAEADKAITYTNVWRSVLMISATKGNLSEFLNTFK